MNGNDKGLNQFKKSDKGMEISRCLTLKSDGATGLT